MNAKMRRFVGHMAAYVLDRGEPDSDQRPAGIPDPAPPDSD